MLENPNAQDRVKKLEKEIAELEKRRVKAERRLKAETEDPDL